MKKHQKITGHLVRIFMLISILSINACADKNGATEKGDKAAKPKVDIHMAALTGDLKAIQQHINAGSDLNAKEPSLGSTPLITASVFGHTEVAKALINAGADLNIQNNPGSTALHSAAFLCYSDIVEMLLLGGAKKDVKNIYGMTAIESLLGPFENVKPVYDQFSKDLGPLGLKLDYKHLEETRPLLVKMLE
jgi:hypothetical protein